MRNPFDPKQPEDQVPRRAAQLLSYDSIKAFAKELGRPASTLIALAPARDPFSITPLRLAEAKWFAGLYKRFGFGSGVHLRKSITGLSRRKSRSKWLTPWRTKIRRTAGKS